MIKLNIVDNRKIKCIKEYSGDFEYYGIDFIIGNEYNATSFDETTIYVESEDGSDVAFYSLEELSKYFVNTTKVKCFHCNEYKEENTMCEVDFDRVKDGKCVIETEPVCNECYFNEYV